LGVGLVSTQTYYLQGQYQGQFLFGYSELNEEQIEEGIRRLSQVFV
jgi:GntR family transcriptional regulator / MocR family aminotransferase